MSSSSSSPAAEKKTPATTGTAPANLAPADPQSGHGAAAASSAAAAANMDVNDVEQALEHEIVSDEDKLQARVDELQKLDVDFKVFEPCLKENWKHRVIGYTWVDTVKNGEARSRFTVADLKRNAPSRPDTFSPTPSPVSLAILELMALHKVHPIISGDVTCAYPHAPETEEIAVRCPPEWKDYMTRTFG